MCVYIIIKSNPILTLLLFSIFFHSLYYFPNPQINKLFQPLFLYVIIYTTNNQEKKKNKPNKPTFQKKKKKKSLQLKKKET